MKVAIVGAGMAGLTCAQHLVRSGDDVTVFEKSRGVGGRMASRRIDGGIAFDHGAQFFTVRDGRFQAAVDDWRKNDVARQWEGRICVLENGDLISTSEERERFIGLPQANSPCREMASELNIEFQTRAAPPVRHENGWKLLDVKGAAIGEFDCVLCSAPAAQAAEFLTPAPELQQQAATVKMSGCWAAMVGFENSLGAEFVGAFVNQSLLSWVALNSSKPGRGETETWVLHAGPEWSDQHIDESPDEILPQLIDAFWQASRLKPQPICHQSAHRWRYAIPVEPYKTRFLFDPVLMIGACGDWCGGPRVEGAYLSGLELAQAVTSEKKK